MILSENSKEIFKRWELLRIPFNFILLIEGIIGCVPLYGYMPTSLMFIEAIIYGVVANIFYMLGPIFESYIEWLGYNKRPFICITVYSLGLAFSMFVTFVILVMAHLAYMGMP